MNKMLSEFRALLTQEDGQDMVEYALLAAFVALIAAAILVEIAEQLQTIYNSILGFLRAA